MDTLGFAYSSFGVCVLLVALLASAHLALIYAFDRAQMVKPSIQFLALATLFVLWPLVFSSEFWEAFWSNPWIVITYLALAINGMLVLAQISFRGSASKVFLATYRVYRSSDFILLNRSGKALLLILTGATVVYLAAVPFFQTGLYAVLFNAEQSTLAREESLKILSSGFVRYTFSLASDGIAPLAASISYVLLVESRSMTKRISAVFAILFCILFVSLPGARSPGIFILVAMYVTHVARNNFKIRVGGVLFVVMSVLIFTSVLTMLREGVSPPQMLDQGLLYVSYLANRAFMVPFQTVGWHFHYAQEFGFFGVGGIPKLASLLGGEALWVPNIVGLYYAPIFYPDDTVQETINAATSYIASYYAYFGWIALPILALTLVLVDSYIHFLKRVPSVLVPPLLGAMVFPIFGMLQGDFTTAFLSHGFAVLFVVAMLMNERFKFTFASCPLSK